MTLQSPNEAVGLGFVGPHLALAQICANAPLAVQESLRVARGCFDKTDAQLRALSEEAQDQDRIILTEDFKEGPRAFVEKRAPRCMGR
jgi:enoyl-CoA hydratase/carnithine racemase